MYFSTHFSNQLSDFLVIYIQIFFQLTWVFNRTTACFLMDRELLIYLSIYPSIHPSIYLWLYSPCGPWSLSQFITLYTVGRTPWMGDQLVARSLPTHRINAHKHLCLEWNSNPRSPCSRGRRQFMP
jgi:hypothetical protein